MKPKGYSLHKHDIKICDEKRKCLIRRDLFTEKALKPVIRTDNGPQFVSYKFSECCEEIGIEHERIPVKTPNKNAHVESFIGILEDDCLRKSNQY